MRRIDPEMTRRARELRNNATPAERRLWRLLSRYRPPFTRQLVVGNFILDLACREARIAVELDGGQHSDSDYDARRTKWLESEGWTMMRFWNNEVRDNPHAVAESILARVASRLGDRPPELIESREGRARKSRFP